MEKKAAERNHRTNPCTYCFPFWSVVIEKSTGHHQLGVKVPHFEVIPVISSQNKVIPRIEIYFYEMARFKPRRMLKNNNLSIKRKKTAAYPLK